MLLGAVGLHLMCIKPTVLEQRDGVRYVRRYFERERAT
jgi:hypothetical protein